MATWSIEHIPANGGASTFASLGVWGFASLQMQFVNWGIDQAAVTTRGGSIAFEAAQFAYLDKLVVWRDGVRFAHFWVTGLGAAAQMQESRTYILSGPAWWLAQLPFHWPYWPVKSTIEESEKTGAMWLQYALASAIGHGAPLAHETPTTGYAQFDAPAGDLSASRTCLEVVQRAARVHPMSAGTWDITGEVPSFVVRTRSHLAAQSIAVSDSIETFGLMPNPELQAESVRIEYIYGDDATVGSVNDAGTNAGMHGPNRLHVAVPVADAEAAWHAAFLPIAQRLYEGLGVLIWTGAINFHETSPDTPIPHVSPGSCVNLTGGLAEWESMNACAQSVVWSVSPENNDLCSVTLGAPEQLGVQDFLDFAAAGYTSAACAGGNPSPYNPPTPPTLNPGTPGTLGDLNGTSTGGGEPGGSIPVQSRGGTWTKGGFDEFAGHVSTPPKKYRTRTASGGPIAIDCPTLICTEDFSASGSTQFAAATLAITSYIQSRLNGGAAVNSTYGYPPELTCGNNNYVGCGTTDSAVRERKWYGRLIVPGCPQTADGWYCTAPTGIITYTLSDEDTEESARDRMLATAEWGGGATTAIRTVPTTGITGIYRRIRYRTEHTAAAASSHWVFGAWVDGVWVPGHEVTVSEPTVYPTLTGLAIWSRYRLRIVLQKRPVDAAGAAAGDYVTGETIYSAPFSTDINGEGGVDWTEIEPEAGYETAIQSATPELY